MAQEYFVKSFDGTQLYVREQGEGPTVILCDGLGCDGFIWRYLQPKLESRFRVVRWHYRGHGQSAAPADLDALALEDLRRDLHAVFDALEIDRAVVLGHSMGVQVILDFALEHPDRVDGLIPICGSYGHPIDTFHDNDILATVFPKMLMAVKRWPRRAQWIWSNFVKSEVAYQFAMAREVEGRLVRRADFEPYFTHLSSMSVSLFTAMLDKVRYHTVEDRLHAIEQPTLIIAGGRDTFTPVWLSHRMQKMIPNADLLVIPSGTHIAPLETPELLERRIDQFLENGVLSKATRQKRSGVTRKSATKKKSRRKKGTRVTSSSSGDGKSEQASAKSERRSRAVKG